MIANPLLKSIVLSLCKYLKLHNKLLNAARLAVIVIRGLKSLKESAVQRQMGWIIRATQEQDKGSEQVMVAVEDIRNTTNTDLEVIHVMDKSL